MLEREHRGESTRSGKPDLGSWVIRVNARHFIACSSWGFFGKKNNSKREMGNKFSPGAVVESRLRGLEIYRSIYIYITRPFRIFTAMPFFTHPLSFSLSSSSRGRDKRSAKGAITKMIIHDVYARQDWSPDRSAEKGRILGRWEEPERFPGDRVAKRGSKDDTVMIRWSLGYRKMGRRKEEYRRPGLHATAAFKIDKHRRETGNYYPMANTRRNGGSRGIAK